MSTDLAEIRKRPKRCDQQEESEAANFRKAQMRDLKPPARRLPFRKPHNRFSINDRHIGKAVTRVFMEMAGHRDAERTVTWPENSKPHLIEMIDFIHTEPWRSKTFLEEKYVKNGRSIAQFAKQTLSSRATVRDALIEFGVPLKQQGKPGLRPAQVPYGYRRSDDLLVPHLGEQRVIQSVRKMSKDGLSYRKICDFLTSVSVPRKNQGKGWQPEMIRRLLQR